MNILGGLLGALLGFAIVVLLTQLPLLSEVELPTGAFSISPFLGLFFGAIYGALLTTVFLKKFRLSISILAALMVVALLVPVCVFACTFCFLAAAYA